MPLAITPFNHWDP